MKSKLRNRFKIKYRSSMRRPESKSARNQFAVKDQLI